MSVIGGDRVARKLSQLSPAIMKDVRESVWQSGAELVRVAKVLVPVKSGGVRSGITGHQRFDGFLVDFGPLSKVIEGGRDKWIGKDGRRIGTTAAQPFVNPALAVTRKKFKAAAKRAVSRAVKKVMAGA